MSLFHWLSPAWWAYYAEIDRLDGVLAGTQPDTAEYDRAWHNRKGFAANCYPGAPEPDLISPESQAEPEPEAEP
jgi:hypothetical protein